jgi:hypothetical protein
MSIPDIELIQSITIVIRHALDHSEPLPLDLVEWYNKAVERLKEGEKV